MTNILFDANVVLDVLLDRKPHVEASAAAWAMVETRIAKGFLAAHAVTTIHYLIRKELGLNRARQIVFKILHVFGVASVDRSVLQEAVELSWPDFEDAVTAAAARTAGCSYIVTRDPRGFRGSQVRCLTPEAAFPLLQIRPILPAR